MKHIGKALVVAAGLFAAQAAPALAQERMTIATGSSGGVYYLWGGALAKIWSDNIKNLTVNVEATTGQTVNLKLLEAGQVELAMSNIAASYEAWTGTGDFKGKEYRKQRAMFAMYPSYFVAASLADSGIKSLEDWNGKRVSFGTPKGTIDVYGRIMLDVLGIKPAKILNSGWPDVAGQISDHLSDAVGAIGGQPWPPVRDLETTHKLTFYDLSQAQIDKLHKAYPYFVGEKLPKGLYKDQPEGYNSLAFWNVMSVSADVPDDVVYQMMDQMVKNFDVIKSTHPSTAKYFQLADVVRVSPIPLHPGVIKYLKEKGIEVPKSLVP